MKRLGSFVRRNNLTIGFCIIAIALGTILFMLAAATAELQHQQDTENTILSQIKGVTDQLNTNAKDRTDQINQLNRHLDCIVLFFTDPNRSQKTISDIDTCTLKNTNTGTTQSFPQNSGTVNGATQAPNTQPNTSNNTKTSTPAPSEAPARAGFFQRNIVQPIKNLIKAL